MGRNVGSVCTGVATDVNHAAASVSILTPTEPQETDNHQSSSAQIPEPFHRRVHGHLRKIELQQPPFRFATGLLGYHSNEPSNL